MTVKIIVLFILLYSFCVLNVAGEGIINFNCPCGIDRNNYSDDRSYKKDVKKVIRSEAKNQEKSSFRIIGGLKSKYPVPWMAVLLIKTKSHISARRCGAVLINAKFLLTAGHCLCNKQIPLTCELRDGVWRPTYNLTNTITASINVRTISEHARFKDTRLKKAFIHKKFLKNTNVNAYEEGRDGPYDIGIIEMMGRINFNKQPTNKIITMPICLPSKSFKDVGINARVAGYGLIRHKASECITDEKGPDIFTRCSRKHKKGNMQKYEYDEVCIQGTKPPSNSHEICRLFNNDGNKDMSVEEAILLPKNAQTGWYKNDSALKGFPAEISCFSNKAQFGWCKTCNNKAVNNTPGFCDPDVLNDTNDKNVPIPTVDSGWGFCSEGCHSYMMKSDLVSTLDLYVLRETECEEIQTFYKGKKKCINTVLQLCAGVKLNMSPVYYYYEKISGEKIYKFSKIPEGEEPEKWKSKRLKEEPGYDLPFTIGGKDSCYGDSGGPLWTMYENKKVLVGLVSSGTGCAEINRPGVYCRIKYKLDWIHKWAKSGSCTKSNRKKKHKRHSMHNKKHSKKKKKKRKKRVDYTNRANKKYKSSHRQRSHSPNVKAAKIGKKKKEKYKRPVHTHIRKSTKYRKRKKLKKKKRKRKRRVNKRKNKWKKIMLSIINHKL